jgi:hypothetical protein
MTKLNSDTRKRNTKQATDETQGSNYKSRSAQRYKSICVNIRASVPTGVAVCLGGRASLTLRDLFSYCVQLYCIPCSTTGDHHHHHRTGTGTGTTGASTDYRCRYRKAETHAETVPVPVPTACKNRSWSRSRSTILTGIGLRLRRDEMGNKIL